MRVQFFGVIADSDGIDGPAPGWAADRYGGAPGSEEVAYTQFEWWARLLSDARLRHAPGPTGAGQPRPPARQPGDTPYRVGPPRRLPAGAGPGSPLAAAPIRAA